MNYKNYTTRVWEYLGEYKRNVLGITDDVQIGKVNYKHILPKGQEDKNLLLIGCNYAVDENKLSLLNHKEKITLHAHWGHLNSSQILCISYFYPIINNSVELNRIIRFINDKTDMNIPETAVCGEFECEATDKTSVDFVIYLDKDKNKKINFEIKYTEENFGKASQKIKIGDKQVIDNDHYEKFQDKYHSDVHITFRNYKNNYQFVRNVSLAKNGNYTIFVVPQKNERINKNYEKAKKCVKNASDFLFDIIYWEDLLNTVKNDKVFEKYFGFMR